MTYVDNLRLAGSESTEYSSTMEGQYYEASRIVHQIVPDAHIKIYDQETNYDTPVTTTLLSYRFILADKNEKNVDSTLKHLTDYKDVAIYENTYTANGVFVPRLIDDWEYDESHPFSSINNLTTGILGTSQVFNFSTGESERGFNPVINDDGTEDVRNLNILFMYTPSSSGDLYGSIYGLRHFGQVSKGKMVTVSRTYPSWGEFPKELESEYCFFSREDFESFSKSMIIAEMKSSTEGKASYQIKAPINGYIILPYSSLSGWKIRINSTESTPSSFMNRVLMVPVSEGMNTIEITYSPTWLIVGIVVSLVILCLFILIAIRDSIRIKVSNHSIGMIAGWLQENYVYVTIFAVATIIFIVMQMYTSCTPFGTRSTLVGDGYIQNYNGYVGIANRIKNGIYSPVDWNIGIALDEYNVFLNMVTSPWIYLKNLIMPESLLLFDLSVSYYLSYILPGLSIVVYLTHRRRGLKMTKKDPRLIAVGLFYGLSSYAINYFVYGNFGFLSYAPLLLLGMERLIYDKKPALYIILLFQQMSDAYYAFILCEFLALFFFTLDFEGVKDFIRKGIRFALASIAAAGLSCFRLIPYYFRTLESPYSTVDTISPVTKSNGSFLSVVADSMTHREAIITTTDNYRVNYYMGILVLLVIPLYLMNKKIKLSSKIRNTLLLMLFFVAFGNSVLNYVFHGFHYQSMVPNRFSAFFMIILIIMFYDCLIVWNEYSRLSFCLGLGIPAIVLGILWSIYALTSENFESTALIVSMIFLVIYILFFILQLWKKHQTTFRTSILIICIIEVILNAFYTFPRAIGSDTVDSSDRNSINVLAARNPDMKKPFVSTEYISDACNIAEATDIRSDSFFSSLSTNGHMQLFIRWNLLTSSNDTNYLAGNPLADMMLHIKYNLSNDMNDSSWSHYPIIDHHGAIELHENPYFLPLGIFMENTEELREWDTTDYSDYDDGNGGNAFEFQNAFSHALGCGDIYNIIEPETDESKISKDDSSTITYITADPSDYIEGKQSEIPTEIHLSKDVDGDVYFSYFNSISFAGNTKKGEADVFPMTMYLPYGRKDYYMRIATVNQEELEKLYHKLNQSTLQNISIDFTTIRGKISAPQDGLVYLSLPFMKGWTIYVDGEKTDKLAMLGGTGIQIAPGEHTIEIKYVPQGAWLGLLCTGSTILLLIIYVVIRRKTTKRKLSSAKCDHNSES